MNSYPEDSTGPSYPPGAPGYPGGSAVPPAGPVEPGAPRLARVALPKQTPLVVFVILGLTVLVYAFQYLSPYIFGYSDLPAILGMKVNELIVAGQYWRLFTPMLLHGSLIHLGFNMYALYSLGPGLESHYGHGRFLALYILAGFAGNVISFLFSSANSLGSSTAIFGLLGAEGIFLYHNRQLFPAAQRALTSIITIALVNLAIGLTPGIDNWGHVGGLLGGTLFAWFAGPRLTLEGIYPNLSLADARTQGDVLRAGLLVFAIFGALAVAAILAR